MRILLIITVCVCIISCSSEAPLEQDDNSNMPIVTGIYHTYENGQPAGYYGGSPTSNLEGNDIEIYQPFPSPYHVEFSIMIKTNVKKNVNIILEPAVISKSFDTTSHYLGKYDIYSQKRNTYDIFSDIMESGTNTVVIFDSINGEQIPFGFYRLFVQTDNDTLWVDVLKFLL